MIDRSLGYEGITPKETNTNYIHTSAENLITYSDKKETAKGEIARALAKGYNIYQQFLD